VNTERTDRHAIQERLAASATEVERTTAILDEARKTAKLARLRLKAATASALVATRNRAALEKWEATRTKARARVTVEREVGQLVLLPHQERAVPRATMLTATEVAHRLGVSDETVKRLLKEGQFNGVATPIGGKGRGHGIWRFDAGRLEEWVVAQLARAWVQMEAVGARKVAASS
jgi:excisionase family DNA binding protein